MIETRWRVGSHHFETFLHKEVANTCLCNRLSVQIVRRTKALTMPMPRKEEFGARCGGDRHPSQVLDVYWLYAARQGSEYPDRTDNSGKWLLFVPLSQVDALWARIKLATEQGRLGGSSKVATARPNPNEANAETKVICVYTYDWTDEADPIPS